MRGLVLTLGLLLCGLITGTASARAEDLATLVADRVTVQSGSVLLAEGHVEVFFQGQRLAATAISYDRAADRLTITGPILLQDEAGNVFSAETAELSADMTEGLLTSARLVLDRQLQMTASEILRSDGGRITALRSVAASSCTICRGNPTPLWEIRAREVVHDADAQQIYFSDATLRFAGVPVLYLPILRVPDPTLNRATGFLIPKIRSTTALGTGLKLPYFITLGRSRDLTLTPYLTTGGDRTVELRFRQALPSGQFEVNGAVTSDTLMPGELRGYLKAEGQLDLGSDYVLSFDGITVSDPAYLVDYGISDADRLLSQLALTRLHRDLSFSARLIGLRSLRVDEDNSLLPTMMADIGYERRFTPLMLGGVAALRLDSHADSVTEGSDLARIGVSLDWRRDWVTPQGLMLGALAYGAIDAYRISSSTSFGAAPYRFSGAAAVELRWPLIRTAPGGAVQTIEPVAQLVLGTPPDASVPNGDSTLVEFDESSLFALDRYPGADGVEGGTRLNLGASWRLEDPSGWALGVTVGRVLRAEDLGKFSNASGLGGLRSDWLLAWSFTGQGGFNLTNRLVLDDKATLTKGELRFGMDSAGLNLSGGYEYLIADPEESRFETASEIVLQAGRDLSRNWHANLETRYDVRAARLATAGLELDFRNECIDVTLSLARRYASSTSLRPTTDLGLSVELLGFGGGAAGPARTCRR